MKKFPLFLLSLMLLLSLFAGCSAKSEAMNDSASEPKADAEYYADAADVEELKSELGQTLGTALSPNEKIIYTMSANIETEEFDDTIEAVYDLIERYGGFIESSHISGRDYGSARSGYQVTRSASFTIRVPKESFEDMRGALPTLGNVLDRSASTENITPQYYDSEARLTAYEAEEERILQLLEKAGTLEEVLIIEERLSEIRYNIEAIKTRLNSWQNQVDYSTISLWIAEVGELTVETPIKQSYGDKITSAFESAVKGVWKFIKWLGLFLASAIPILILPAIIAVVIIIIEKKKRIRKKAKIAPEATPPADFGDTEKDK